MQTASNLKLREVSFLLDYISKLSELILQMRTDSKNFFGNSTYLEGSNYF